MNTTIIYKNRISEVADAVTEGANLWLNTDDLHSSTGWELTPEGACMGEICIPIPPGREAGFLSENGKLFNVSALERHINNPVVKDHIHSVWLFGEGTARSGMFNGALHAPDFTLPDLDN